MPDEEEKVMLDSLMTVQQAAERKQVSQSTVYKAMRSGRLPVVRALGRNVLRLQDVEAWEPLGWGGSRRGQKVSES